MRFSTLVAAATAAVGFTSALPTPAENEAVERASSATFHISNFGVSLYPNTNDVYYNFYVRSTSNDVNRKFPEAYCTLSLKGGDFVPVFNAICSGNNNIYFSWQRYNQDGESGWKLGIDHPYHTIDGLFVDYVVKKFPESSFVTKGKGKKLHTVTPRPSKFELEA